MRFSGVGPNCVRINPTCQPPVAELSLLPCRCQGHHTWLTATEMRGSLILGICVAMLHPIAALMMSSALLKPSAALNCVRRTSKLTAQTGWATGVDPATGATYYYNEQTGQSQWEPPVSVAPAAAAVAEHLAAQSQAQSQAAGAGAQKAGGARATQWTLAGLSGVTGFDFTQDNPTYSSWGLHATVADPLPYTLSTNDEQVLSRWNMVHQQLTVSRKQCLVKCLGDGTATLTSVGMGPTLWRMQGNPWCALQKGDKVTLTDGDQISLDCNDPEAAVFVCLGAAVQQGGGQQGGYQQEGGGYAQQDPSSYAQQQQNPHAQQAQPQQAHQGQLPYPWEQLADQNGNIYFWNPQTGEASWEPPQHVA